MPTDPKKKWIKRDINSRAFIQPQQENVLKYELYIKQNVLVEYAR